MFENLSGKFLHLAVMATTLASFHPQTRIIFLCSYHIPSLGHPSGYSIFLRFAICCLIKTIPNPYFAISRHPFGKYVFILFLSPLSYIKPSRLRRRSQLTSLEIN